MSRTFQTPLLVAKDTGGHQPAEIGIASMYGGDLSLGGCGGCVRGASFEGFVGALLGELWELHSRGVVGGFIWLGGLHLGGGL